MGVLWTVWPLDSQMTDWLDEQGIAYPAGPSRFPTGREIRRILGEIGGRIDLADNGVGAPFSAFIELTPDSWTSLQIERYGGDEEPQSLHFDKGDEKLIIDILGRLAAHCGPLALINDVGDPPEVISAAEVTP